MTHNECNLTDAGALIGHRIRALMYHMELMEWTMAAPIRKTVDTSASSSNGDRRFPPESYLYDDDVTPEAVEIMRQKAAKTIESQEWEVVDGFAYSA